MKTFLAALIVQMTVFSAGAEAAPETSLNFVAAPAHSRDVFEAARFAAKDRKVRLLNVQSADEPSDSHISYRLCLLVRSGDERFLAAAEISRSGMQRLALTRWFPGGC